MGILDFFNKNKKQAKAEKSYPINIYQNSEYPGCTVIPNEDREKEIINHEIEELFPKTGKWTSSCIKRPNEINATYLPCHLRDNKWIAKLIKQNLLNKGISCLEPTILNHLNESTRFNELRHSYELEIVKWQIEFIMDGGTGWLMPEGYDEMSLMVGSDIHNMVRYGIQKTLQAIGMNSEVIEEGIEKNLDIWLTPCLNKSFSNLYEPHYYWYGSPLSASQGHRSDWVKAKEYEYYQRHQESVDKYGTKTLAMQMSSEKYKELVLNLKVLDKKRKSFLVQWQKEKMESVNKSKGYVEPEKE